MYQGTDFSWAECRCRSWPSARSLPRASASILLLPQIQRQMVDQNRTQLGGNQVLSYNYRILISSYKNQPVKLQLWDRLPKGENESVTVTLVKQSPNLSKDGIYDRESRPNNLLRWDLEVPANCSGETAMSVTYEFSTCVFDRQMAITGFQSRYRFSVPGSAWDRTACEAPPRTGGLAMRIAPDESGRQSLPGSAFPGRAWERGCDTDDN